jgi:hypothetical protein
MNSLSTGSDNPPGSIADMRDETSRGILSSKFTLRLQYKVYCRIYFSSCLRFAISGQIVEYVRRLETRVSELEKQETISCPESVLNALQVLQVCQGLDDHDIGDQEKALVRQMCNVIANIKITYLR